MNNLNLYDKTRKTNVKSTVFSDGMIVTADDLDSAMRYPIDLFQTLIRAYFGCGIVCGLEVHREPRSLEEGKHTFCIKIEPGVALDCHGHPLQVCETEKIDLTPDPCTCEDPPTCLCIAIRRDTMPEAPRESSDDCDDNGKPRRQYGRQRELVRIKVFKCDDLPKTLCAHTITSCDIECSDDTKGKDKKESADTRHDPCECLKTCPDCHCCGEAWVLLACVMLDECGVINVDNSRRKYIKPIECFCPPSSKDPLPPDEKCPPEEKPKRGRPRGK